MRFDLCYWCDRNMDCKHAEMNKNYGEDVILCQSCKHYEDADDHADEIEGGCSRSIYWGE